MNPALEQLRDIRGLDPAPWWPPASRGWLFVAAVMLSAAVVVLFYRARHRARLRWRQQTLLLLRRLRSRLEQLGAHDAAGELGELLRRIAIVYGGRRACAGLVGEAWLAWLEAHDPGGFPWRSEGRCLLELPYAPPQFTLLSAADLEPLISAAEVWLGKPPFALGEAGQERASVAI